MQTPPPVVNREPSTVSVSGWAGVPIVLAVLAVVWIAAASMERAPFSVPGPGPVLASLMDFLLHDDAFPGQAVATMRGAAIGFAVAVVAGALVGGAFAASAPLRLGALVLIALPAMACVPLAIVWLGFGTPLTVTCAAAFALGPVLAGFAAGGSARAAGLDVGAVMALNGTVLAELFAPIGGLGHVMMDAVQRLDIPDALAVALMLLAIALIAVLVVHAVAGLVLRRAD